MDLYIVPDRHLTPPRRSMPWQNDELARREEVPPSGEVWASIVQKTPHETYVWMTRISQREHSYIEFQTADEAYRRHNHPHLRQLESASDWLWDHVDSLLHMERSLPLIDHTCDDLVNVWESRNEYKALTGLSTSDVNAMIRCHASADEYLDVAVDSSPKDRVDIYHQRAAAFPPLHGYLWMEIAYAENLPEDFAPFFE